MNNNTDESYSCKTVAFSTDGTKIYSGGSYGDLCAVDFELACTISMPTSNSNDRTLWRIGNASSTKSINRTVRASGVKNDDNDDEYISINNNLIEGNNSSEYNPVVIVYPFQKDGNGTKLLATGDDKGGIRIWDERLFGGCCGSSNRIIGDSMKRPKGCVLEWNKHKDYVSGINYSPYRESGNNILLTTSADGTLGVYDLRMNKRFVSDTSRTSDHQDDELLSLCVIKNGKKVVCGTQTGTLSIFSWGTVRSIHEYGVFNIN